MSKFELGRPSECEKRQKFYATKLGSHLLHTLGIRGGYQCVTQLSLSLAVVLYLLFAATFRPDAMPCVLKILKLARNYPGHS